MSIHEDDRSVRSRVRGTVQTPTTVDRDSDLLMAPAGWRLSWGAVLAGIIVALAAHIVLNLLGVGIGIAGAPRGTSAEWFGAGFATWWAVAGIIAAAIGGWVAGRTLGSADRNDGMIHGLLSWAGTTLVIAFMLASALGGAIGLQDRAELMAMYGQHIEQQTGAGGAPASSGTATAPSTPGMPSTNVQSTISGAAIASFIALLLGAAAAATAGRAGVSAARRALTD
jgi:hypothetical protein